MALKQEIQWQEPYVSQSLNHKMSGVLPKGVYRGYVLSPGTGMAINISPDTDDYLLSVAVVDRDGYNFTVTSNMTETITFAEGTSGAWFIVLDSKYAYGGGGYSSIAASLEENIEDGWLILGKVTIPSGTTQITQSMIEGAKRMAQTIMFPNPNHLINGSFDIWSFAATQTSSGQGSDDKWYNNNYGSTKVHSRQEFDPEFYFPDGTKAPRYYSRTVVTVVAGASNYVNKTYRVPGVKNFSGGKVALTFHAKADSPKNIAMDFVQNFGTGGSVSISGIGAQQIALSTEWETFTITADIPSVSGKTVSSIGDDYLEIRIWFDAGSSFDPYTVSLGHQYGTFDLAMLKLEAGDEATRIVPRLYEEELALCKDYADSLVPSGAVMHFAGPSTPVGWLVANGNAVSRITYPRLFKVIGTTYGSGDGSTTFNLPDLRGEFIRSLDGGRGIDAGRTLGSWQKGTLVGGYDDNNIDCSIGFLPMRNERDYGSDPVVVSDYGLTEVVWYAGSPDYRSIYSTSRAAEWYSVTRPRNVALLCCIKY